METFRTEIVHKLPNELAAGALYVSLKFRTIAHLCPCGCGEEVITPLSKDRGWVMEYDGRSVSLNPSIGNRNLSCKTHYWIKNNRVEWCIDNADRDNKPQRTFAGFTNKMLNWILSR